MIEIVDTHQHLWELDRFRYSWCAGIPTLNHSFTMRDYLAAASKLPDDAKLAAAVHVEADVDEPHMAGETRWVLSLAEADDNPTAGVVACCRPEHDGFREYLDQFEGHAALKGVRRVLHTQADDLSESSLFAENLNALPQYGLTFDLCVLARQLPRAVELVRRCPRVSFVLDHCGVPDVKGRAHDPWREHIQRLAALPNVLACKISGLVAYADPVNWTTDDLRPFVDHVVERFGHDRIMFGSDWPVCTLTCSYVKWVSAALELTSEWSAGDREKLFATNARRVYRLA
jgi:predicted TIM-barrel fold metal-dependent hydrolase